MLRFSGREKTQKELENIGRSSALAREKSRSIQYINKLRICAVYAVVAGHIAIWTTDPRDLMTDAGDIAAPLIAPLSVNWWIGKWIHLTCLFAIPVFVMISGALLLDDSRNESAWSFYKRRMQRIGIPLVFWTIVYLIIRKVVDAEDLTAGRAAELILTADPYYHLWFLFMIPGLYLVTPPLRVFVRNSTSTERILLIALIFVLASVYSPINNLFLGNRRSIFTMFIPYIAYYMAGYEIRHIDPRKVPFKYLVAAVIICAIYIVVLAGPFIDLLSVGKAGFLYDGFSPPVIVMGMGIFWAVYLIDRRTKPLRGIRKTAVEWMASTTLGIYVLHPLVLSYMRDRFSDESAEGGFLFTITAGPLAAFIACYLIASLIINIPFLRRTIT